MKVHCKFILLLYDTMKLNLETHSSLSDEDTHKPFTILSQADTVEMLLIKVENSTI